MNRILIGGIALVLVIGATVFLLAQNRSDVGASDLDRLSALSFTDYSGNQVTLGTFKGKPLIINTWAAWCPFCKQELPDFATLQSEFPNVVVIAIDRQESLETAKRYTDELGLTGTMTLLLDPFDGFYKAIGGFSMPETIFIDAGGHTVFHKRGPLTLDEMREAVKQYLQ